jgi:hypothetical protein
MYWNIIECPRERDVAIHEEGRHQSAPNDAFAKRTRSYGLAYRLTGLLTVSTFDCESPILTLKPISQSMFIEGIRTLKPVNRL